MLSASTDTYVRMNPTSTANNPILSVDSGLRKYMKVEYDLLVATGANFQSKYLALQFYTSSSTSAVELGKLAGSTDDGLYVGTEDGKKLNYEEGKWLSFVWYFDFVKGTYTLHVNNTLVTDEAALPSEFTDLTAVKFQGPIRNGLYTVYFDNLKISNVTNKNSVTTYTKKIFNETFSGYDKIGDISYIVKPSSDSANTQFVSKSDGSKYLGIYFNSSGGKSAYLDIIGDNYGYDANTGLKVFSLEFDVAFANAGRKASVQASTVNSKGSTSATNENLVVFSQSDSTLSVAGQTISYTPGDFVKVKFEMDYDNHTYTAYLNGDVVKKDYAMTNKSTHSFSMLRGIINSGTSTEQFIFLDNIKLYTVPNVKITRETETRGKVFYNIPSSQETARIITAVYDGEVLKSAKISDAVTPDSTTSIFSRADAEFSMKKGQTVKIFVWNDCVTATPIEEVTVVN